MPLLPLVPVPAFLKGKTLLSYLPAEPGPSSPCLPGTKDPNWSLAGAQVLSAETEGVSARAAPAVRDLVRLLCSKQVTAEDRGSRQGWQEVQVPEKRQQEV